VLIVQAQLPDNFAREGDEDFFDADALATQFGWIDGYRIIYHQLPQNWDAYSPDLDGVISTGSTREVVERNMREAIHVHLQALAEDRRARPWLYDSVASS
jgi:predicted RNase H-like HicB family nuclease